VATRHLIYGKLDALFAVPWRDWKQGLDDRAPGSLPELPRIENEGAADYVLAANGILAYIAGGPARYAQRLVWVDQTGGVEPLPLPERDYEAVALSPDGQRAVLQIREGAIGLWIYDFARRRSRHSPLRRAAARPLCGLPTAAASSTAAGVRALGTCTGSRPTDPVKRNG
jgi:hypothetical protein